MIWLHNQRFPFRFKLLCIKQNCKESSCASPYLLLSYSHRHICLFAVFRFYFYVKFFFYLKSLMKPICNPQSYIPCCGANNFPRFESIYEMCTPQSQFIIFCCFSFHSFSIRIADTFELMPPVCCIALHMHMFASEFSIQTARMQLHVYENVTCGCSARHPEN